MRNEAGDAHISLRTELIDYTDGEEVFEAYVSIPNGIAGRSATVLLAHEWSGLNEGMRRVANRIAEIGYVCFAMDVYGKGIRGDQAGDNSHLMMPLIRDRRLLRQRLLAGLRAATQHPSVDPSRIAALGYCFGGLCALDLARAVPPELRSVVTFHAALSPPGIHPQKPMKASILVLHGWEDRFAPPDEVLAIARELTEAEADWQLHCYGHAMHAFTFEGINLPDRGLAYNANASRRSWNAMRAFLTETLE